jgi:uncharacterized small protein (DUF1192 family)
MMENMKLPIALVAALAVQLAGGVWWVSQQAATITSLTEDIAVLTAENNATDRTNLIRDVEQNADNIDEMIDILVEWQEEFEEADEELWEDSELLWEEAASQAKHMVSIMELQKRVAVLENTIEYMDYQRDKGR